LLRKYCKERASIITHFWVPAQKRRKCKKIKKIYSEEKSKKIYTVKRGCQNTQNNGQKLVEEVQKYKD
jgi:hypothetical protein